jgi:predicted DNA-binding transcriptional regulator AlpA
MGLNCTDRTDSAIDAALRAFTFLPDEARVRVGVVATLYGVSVPTVWRWARSGILPAPSKTVGTTSWRVGEIRANMKERAATGTEGSSK